MRGANSYVFLGGEGLVVVDTGLPGNASRIVSFVRGLNEDPSFLRYIVLTHSDLDHSGSVARLKEKMGAEVAIHSADARRLSGEARLKDKGAAGTLVGLIKVFMRFTPVKPDILLEGSGRIGGLSVIHTPGHTDGSVSLYLQDEALFTGDALLTNRKGLLQLPRGAMTSNPVKTVESVRKISELTFNCLLPGHGAPILSDASSKLREFVINDFKNR